VWEDFAQGREGVLMPIMPPSWLFGIVHPEYAFRENPKLDEICMWLKGKPFQIWPYLAIESCGPGGKFNAATVSTIVQCAKPLFYSRFGQMVAENSQITGIPYIHHGIYTDRFKPSSPEVVAHKREELKCDKDTVLIGCCATNTNRKRLGLLFAAFADYQDRYNKNSRLWLHTNKEIADWNIPELARAYNLVVGDPVAVSYSKPYLTDQWLADFYSACDVTVLPTYGEGFGYPIIESISCETPCVTGSFACEAELGTHCVGYMTEEVDGIHNLVRPHYRSHGFADMIDVATRGDYMGKGELHAKAFEKWDWSQQWPKFKEWLLK
jgi:glycosyltransferase involved in cell wall biosynthesis